MTHETPKWQTLWLLVGFGLLMGIGVVTVLLPELQDERGQQDDREQAPESQLVSPADPVPQE